VTDLRERGCAVLVISHLFFERQRFDVLYRLQEGQVHLQDRSDAVEVTQGTRSTERKER